MKFPTTPPLPDKIKPAAPLTKDATAPRQLKRYKLPMRSEYVPEWVAMIREAKYPGTVIVLDFETYFDPDYSLKKISTIEYIMDGRFEVLGLSTFDTHVDSPFRDYEQNTIWWNGEEDVELYLRNLQGAYGIELKNCTVVMHNATFDASILAYRYEIWPKYVIDTIGLARHWHSRHKHGLGVLAERYGLPAKGDIMEFTGWTNRHRVKPPKGRKKKVPDLPVIQPLIGNKSSMMAEYANNDVMRTWELFTILMPKLSWPEVELPLMQNTLDLFIRPTLEIDYAKATELMAEMNGEMSKAIGQCNVAHKEISGDSFEALLEQALVRADDDPIRYRKPAKNKKGWKYAVAKDDEARGLLANHEDQAVRDLMAAKEAISSWPLHIKRIARIVAQTKAAGGKLPVPLRYCGCHTRRFSGTEKINLQNLGSRGHPLVNSIRNLLIAPGGMTLVVVDQSQIEGRGVGWIAEDQELLDEFESGAPIYCNFASKVLGRKIRKPDPNGVIPEIEAYMTWARNSVGKTGVLGCGYGMGWKKAMALANGEIDATLAKKIVDTYREERVKIVQFWKNVESAFFYTTRTKRSGSLPHLRFDSRSDCDVVITLPNSGELKYHDVRIDMGKYGPTLAVFHHVKKTWKHIWGGAITENIVQAISRDALVEALLKLEAEYMPTVLSIHDELVIMAHEEHAEVVLKRAIEVLSERPTWAPDWPLAAEGIITKFYKAH